jgi:hypothetical protein
VDESETIKAIKESGYHGQVLIGHDLLQVLPDGP